MKKSFYFILTQVFIICSCQTTKTQNFETIISGKEGSSLCQVIYNSTQILADIGVERVDLDSFDIFNISTKGKKQLSTEEFSKFDILTGWITYGESFARSKSDFQKQFNQNENVYYLGTRDDGDILIVEDRSKAKNSLLSFKGLSLYLFSPSLNNIKSIRSLGGHYKSNSNALCSYIRQLDNHTNVYVDSTIYSDNIIVDDTGKEIQIPTVEQKFTIIDQVIQLIDDE